MKYWSKLFGILALTALAMWLVMGPSDLESHYQEVQEGMTRAQVHQIMGMTDEISDYSIVGGETWVSQTRWRVIEVEVTYAWEHPPSVIKKSIRSRFSPKF